MRKNIGLYRGKRTDGEGWVYGYLSTKTICVPGNVHFGYIIQKPSAGLYQNEWFEVDKDTLGEYISASDKNGKGIFEGDIVKYGNGLASEIYQVVYNEKWMRFAFTKPNTVFAVFNMSKCEVIGNIFDNAELLKERN